MYDCSSAGILLKSKLYETGNVLGLFEWLIRCPNANGFGSRSFLAIFSFESAICHIWKEFANSRGQLQRIHIWDYILHSRWSDSILPSTIQPSCLAKSHPLSLNLSPAIVNNNVTSLGDNDMPGAIATTRPCSTEPFSQHPFPASVTFDCAASICHDFVFP